MGGFLLAFCASFCLQSLKSVFRSFFVLFVVSFVCLRYSLGRGSRELHKELLSDSSRTLLSLSNPNNSTYLGKQVTMESCSRKDNDDINLLVHESDGEDDVVWEDDVG